MLLPNRVVSAEVATVKRERSLAWVADKAVVHISSVREGYFIATIDKGFSILSEFGIVEEDVAMVISDEESQQIAVMAHQVSRFLTYGN